jgi:adenosylhomocysteine nucleosidase
MSKTSPLGTCLAIVSAMEQELSAVLALLPDEQKVRVAGREFWVGHLHGQQVVAVLSRIGKVAAATTATLLIERFGATAVLFTGVAGGLGPGVERGDIVVADSFLQHDLDASPIFPKYEVPLYGISRFATDAALSARLEAAAGAVALDAARLIGADATLAFGISRARLHRGLVLSGDRFVSSSAESAALRQAMPDALAVEMEGAAVAQVCHDYGVPLAAVRVISDRADDAAHVDFLGFVEAVASRYSAAVLEQLLA